MDNKKSKPLVGGGWGIHQLNNNDQLFNLQLFADGNLNYNKVNNPYEFYLNKPTWTKGDIKAQIVYNLAEYYKKIPNYSTITTLPEENAEYIKEALPNVTSCYYMLYNCRKLTSIDTTGWDTSNVTNMNSMFWHCNTLTTLDVSNWNTSKATNMRLMFEYCRALTTIKGVIDMKSCISYDGMFNGCTKLTGVKIKNPPIYFETLAKLTKDQYTIVS